MEIEVQNLTFSYGKQPALREVSFSVQKGTLTAVLGANGAGKSTLFRCLLIHSILQTIFPVAASGK